MLVLPALLLSAVLVVAASGAGLAAPPGDAPGNPGETADDGLRGLVDHAVTSHLAGDRIPGAAVAVVAGGRTVYSRGYGVADVERRTPVVGDRTAFHPASVVKLFTATAASQLIMQGRIDPDADVNRYLDTFRIHDTFPGHPVTMNALLTHSAGFDQDFVGLNDTTGDGVAPLRDTLADLQPARMRPPGTAVAYDNYGFALAGHVVEVVSGMPFDHYVRQHILDPLGMDATTLAQPHPDEVTSSVATGYRPAGDGYTAARGQYGPWTPTGAGAVTTAPDMARFINAQLTGDPRLGEGVTDLMQRRHFGQDPRVPGMGYGFAEGQRGSTRLLLKDGDLPGFHSNLALLPEHGIGIFVVYNGDGTDGTAYQDAKDLVLRIVDHYIPPTDPPTPTATSDPARYAGTYRASTTSLHSLMKVSALTTPVTVEADTGGGLVTTGLSADPAADPRHWVQAEPDLFVSDDGQERLAFDEHGALVGAGPEATSYERLAWYQNPTLHMIALGLGATVLIISFVWFPATALLRRSRRVQPTRGPRLARLTGWASAALAVAFTSGFVLLTSDGNAMMEAGVLGSPLLTALPFVASAMILTSAGVVVATPIAWRNRWWSRPGLLGYTVLAVASVAFVSVAIYYNLAALGDLRGS
ncbi:CubicO group peptidase (beta-lactamase class C family) [Pseudonocardia endophytica]|uniref:CubicO group peptidase (Beta-lactamase class C family) n=2 Tax=Pseudonocardia endophytica TaxID=401976 RepID=A0A4V2PJ14_PSEEN|nr:CubicO group peptidase (beta-lactamase class C family) [Pseudonocardia endophytica]